MELTEQQKLFFNEFGFLQFPGLLADRIDSVIEDFENVFTVRGGGHNGAGHDGSARSCIVPFVDQSVGLCSLLDDPRIAGIAAGLLGDDWNYIGSDGNFYVGDTGWHTDGWHPQGRYIKIAFYLDRVTRDTGALRIIPGSQRINPDSHKEGEYNGSSFKGLWDASKNYGIEGRDMPSHALEVTPGDIAVFNHNIFHSAWGGSNRRRMFTLNLCNHAESPAEIADLRGYIGSNARFWIDEMYGKTMLETAGAERMKHLQQVLDNSDELPSLVAKAKETMSEPSRG